MLGRLPAFVRTQLHLPLERVNASVSTLNDHLARKSADEQQSLSADEARTPTRPNGHVTPRTRRHLAATPSPRPRCATPICACAHHGRLRLPMPPSRSLFAHATSPQLLTALRLGPRAKAFIDLLVLCGRIAEERSRRVSAGLRYRVL